VQPPRATGLNAMRKPPVPPASGKSKGQEDRKFPGGRAMERVRQFERARGIGPPKRADAPEMPKSSKDRTRSKTRKK